MANLIRVLAPTWTVPDTVSAFTTLRNGGVSLAPFDSLNLGDHVGDAPHAVRTNRERLNVAYGLPQAPHWLNQTHGDCIVRLTRQSGSKRALDSDGAITSDSGVVCAVMTADCMPILISNSQGSQVAAVHAGWRGIAQGILEKAVDQFDDDPRDLLVWAGPCIGPTAFEIGTEVRDSLGGDDACYRPAPSPGKLFANLYSIAALRLLQAGVQNYSHSTACTYRDQHDYFSYRRDGICGRMASVIWINP